MAKKSDDPPKLWARVVVGSGLFAVMLAVLATVGVLVHYGAWTQRPTLVDGKVTVVVPKGTSWTGVVQLLEESGVVAHPRYFDLWGRRAELPPKVKAGTYTFEGPLTLEELSEKLSKGGNVAEVAVTLPEGLNIWGIAAKLEEAGLVDADRFVAAAKNADALQRAGINGESFDGYLFPDTYRFAAGSTAEQLIERMHKRFIEVWLELGSPEEANGLTRHELVTLASIVEKETAAVAERPLIARVFYNRLAIPMRLQTDPTCVYSRDRWSHPPRPSDCKDPLNRYSTYVIDGLPPGPIANPGRAALQAVLTPDADPANEGVLYFVAVGDGSGKHTFSKTLDEHNAAVRTLIENRASP